MLSLSEPGAQRPTTGAYPLGKTKTWKKHFQKERLVTSYFKGLLQLQPGTALL